MFGLGFGEVLLLGIFALLFIGPKKLPEVAQTLGKVFRDFQKAKDDMMTQIHVPPPTQPTPPPAISTTHVPLQQEQKNQEANSTSIPEKQEET